MANTLPSIYMNLPVPVPTVQVGPQWATDINTCLTQIDSHTHSSGSGQQITPAGISINQDLPFYNNNSTLLRSVRFQAQPTVLSQPTDLRCLYSSSADLYFNDSAGNQIRITQNGGIAGTPGSITGLLSPASVSYISGSQTFVFQSSTATPANLDAGAITLRNVLANSKGITLAPPAALAANYSIALPATLPSTGSKLVSLDSGGNLSTVSNYGVDNVTIQLQLNSLSVKSGGIGYTQRGNLNSIPSSTATAFSTTSTTFQQILSTTITTTGKPVMLFIQPSGASVSPSAQSGVIRWNSQGGAVGTGRVDLKYNRDSTTDLALFPLQFSAGGATSFTFTAPFSCTFLDSAVTAGTHTYYLLGAVNSTFPTVALNMEVMQLVAIEMG